MIYDRLDRITRESGGTQLIRDLVKLPDAEKYAKSKTLAAYRICSICFPKDSMENVAQSKTTIDRRVVSTPRINFMERLSAEMKKGRVES